MAFLRGITEKLRGGVRATLCTGLRALEINARVADRGRKEEGIFGGLMGNTLGLLEVRDNPIRWINVLEHPGNRFAPTTYSNVYIVPDDAVFSGGYFDLRSVPVRSESRHGRVIDIRWEVSFSGRPAAAMPPATPPAETPGTSPEQRLASRFVEDVRLKETLIRLDESFRIRSVPNYWCWAISSSSYEIGQTERMVPTPEQWGCFQAIAGHLLAFSQDA